MSVETQVIVSADEVVVVTETVPPAGLLDVQEAIALTGQYRDEAEGFKNQAGVSAEAAAGSAVLAGQHKDATEGFKNAAGVSAGAASGAAVLAGQHKDAAEGFKNAAGVSAGAASGAAVLAGQHKDAAEGFKNQAGASAAAALRERRHEWAAPYSYSAMAPGGSAESAAVWTITRIAVAADGGTTVLSAAGVAWDDRVTAPYA